MKTNKTQFQKRNIPWNNGKEWSKEIKEKISKSVKSLWQNSKYKNHMSEVHKRQISSMEGKHHTKETKEKISKRLIGRHLSEVTRKKIGEVEKGEKHWNWKGGITSINIKIRNSLKSKSWRNNIFTRDNWTCQKCRKRGIELRAHHILSFSEHQKLKFEVDNGITLCKGCHISFHKIYGRKANTKKEIENFLKSENNMKKNIHDGKFVAFEGLDGSGQSTQTSLLRDFLIEKGFQTITTKEPTLDSEAGRRIKEILDEKIKTEPAKLQELFSQDRKEHLEKVIIPALKEGKWVISDRYFFSTFAYGTSEGLDLEWLIKLNDSFLLPDQTFILKVKPEVCIDRINKRGTKKQLFEKQEKLAKVWQTYTILPQRIENTLIVDGERAIEEVSSEIKEIISKLI